MDDSAPREPLFLDPLLNESARLDTADTVANDMRLLTVSTPEATSLAVCVVDTSTSSPTSAFMSVPPSSAQPYPRRTSRTGAAGPPSSSPSSSRRSSSSSVKPTTKPASPRSPTPRTNISTLPSSPRPNVVPRFTAPSPVSECPMPTIITAIAHATALHKADLSTNHQILPNVQTPKAVVILQDDCYGHRFSRPRTSKGTLGSIVERPERISASVLGVSTAYVLLGGRHKDGSAARPSCSDRSAYSSIPFLIRKTDRRLPLRSPAITNVHGTRWMGELSRMCELAEVRLATGGKELARSHEAGPDDSDTKDSRAEFHEGDLYLCADSQNAFEGALGGVCEAIDLVFGPQATQRAFVCIRPPGHHCSTDMPSGFCWLNNVHVGINYASIVHGLTHAAIIDIDLHHGDGSQSLTWAHNTKMSRLPKNTPLSKKTAIGYFSVHDINSYPCEFGDEDKVRNASLCIENAHGQSIWNIHLQPWKSEAEFWTHYETHYKTLIHKTRAFLKSYTQKLEASPTRPKARSAIFISAGFDASEWETPHMQRHQVNVPTGFYARFTQDVVEMSQEIGLGTEGRVISVLEGGYSDRALTSGVLSHVSGLAASERLACDSPAVPEMSTYDPTWWTCARLDELEGIANGQPPTNLPVRQRNDTKATYISATESFKAKVVVPPSGRRSLSGTLLHQAVPLSAVARGPTPPPPEIDWITAARALSGILVPQERQTKSCSHTDLNGDATRIRREKIVGLAALAEPLSSKPETKRMNLREKRLKPIVGETEVKKQPSRASRRKTVANVNLLASELDEASNVVSLPNMQTASGGARRRSSSTSSRPVTSSDVAHIPLPLKELELKMPTDQTLTANDPSIPGLTEQPATKPARRPKVGFRAASSPNKSRAAQPRPLVQSVNASPDVLRTTDGSSELDNLSSGMKKMSIKLHVPPKEEYEARLIKSKPIARGRPPKLPGKAPILASPTKAKSKTVSPRKFKLPISSTQPEMAEVESQSFGQAAAKSPQPDKSDLLPPTPNVQTTDQSLIHGIMTDTILPLTSTPPNLALDPVHGSAASTISTDAPITIRRTKNDLPIFTTSTPIPFGPKSNPTLSQTNPHTTSLSSSPRATSIPLPTIDNDQKVNLSVAGPAAPRVDDPQQLTRSPAQPITGPIHATLIQAPAHPEPSGPDLSSIWDIPDTPLPARKT